MMTARLTIEEMQELAKSRGGECLSKEYINTATKLLWRCDVGHQWYARPSCIKFRLQWCPECYGNTPHTIIDAEMLARLRGGTCLSSIYRNAHAKLLWQCGNKHEWCASFHNVNRGTWCPYCGAYIRENIIREIFNRMFNAQFIKCHPDWLQSDISVRPLELDGYNEELKLAFEHQGEQHYHMSSYLHQEKINLATTQKRDEFKKSACSKRGVRLVIVPFTVPLNDLIFYIKDQCALCGILPLNMDFNIVECVNSAHADGKLAKLRKIARKRGGACLAIAYYNNMISLPFICKFGHEWSASPASIIGGSWCRRCVHGEPLSLEIARQCAALRDGKCLSTSYKNAHAKLKWQCANGHIWHAALAKIKYCNEWCPMCAVERRKEPRKWSLVRMKELAALKGGDCVSPKYYSTKIPLKWRCREGHVWETKPVVIIRGSWCPRCYRLRH